MKRYSHCILKPIFSISRVSQNSCYHRNLSSNYKSFEFKTNFESKQEKVKHNGDLLRYGNKVCYDKSLFPHILKEITAIDYPREQRSLLLWSMVRGSKFHSVVEIFDKLYADVHESITEIQRILDHDSLICFIHAFSRTGDYAKMIRLSELIPSSFGPIALNFFIQACCTQNKLTGAEDSMMLWLQAYVARQDPSHPTTISIQAFLTRFNNEVKSLRRPLIAPDGSNSSDSTTPPSSSSSVSEQDDGVSASNLFRELSSSHNLADELPDMMTWYSLVHMYSQRNAWVEISQVILLLEAMNVNSADKASKHLPKPFGWYLSHDLNTYVDHEYTHRKSMMRMYVYYIRSLCEAEKFTTAVEVINTMMSMGYSFDPKLILPLLLVFERDYVGNGYDHRDWLTSSDELFLPMIDAFLSKFQQVAAHVGHLPSISPEMRLRLLSYDEIDTEESIDAEMKTFLRHTSTIIKNLVTVICKRRNPEYAEEFMMKLRAIEAQYGVTLVENHSSNIAAALIKSYVNIGNWQRALELYDAHEAAMADNDGSNPVYPLRESSYHAIAKGMIRSNDMLSLATFALRSQKPAPQPALDIVPVQPSITELAEKRRNSKRSASTS